MQPRDLTIFALLGAVTVVVACGGSSSAGEPGPGTGGADGESPLPEPTVTSFTPEVGPWGTNVTLEGQDLGGTPTFQGSSREGVVSYLARLAGRHGRLRGQQRRRRHGGRARSVDGHWTIDREPIVDPAYGRRGYAAGATSDGSLYVAQAADASSLFDTMEEPRLRRLGPQDAAFGPALPAGNRVDDYVTSITLADRGEGLVVGYCASDTGVFSAPTDTCREGLDPRTGLGFPTFLGKGRRLTTR